MDALKTASLRRTDAVGRMDRAQLDALLARHCRAQGYAVESVGAGAVGARFGDAVDMVLRRGDEFVLLQCRYWTATSIPPGAVHALLDVMADLEATGGVLVTTGGFSSDAVEAASRQGHVELVDGNTLQAMLGPMDEHDDGPPSSGDADRFGQGAYAAPPREDVEWRMPSAADRPRAGAGGAPLSGRRLLVSLGVKLMFAFALVLLFAWAIDAAVHPLLRPLRLHRAATGAGVATSTTPADGAVMAVLPATPQDDDVAMPDAWHQPSQDEFIEQQRRANEASKRIKDDTAVAEPAALRGP